MPALSKAQRRAIAIAEHHPGKLYKRNRGLLKMSRSDMHDFASTKEKSLPMKKTAAKLHKARKKHKKRKRSRSKK